MLKQIKYFQTVVRCSSFSDAAGECYISQSAISQQVQALERELGVTLLKRERAFCQLRAVLRRRSMPKQSHDFPFAETEKPYIVITALFGKRTIQGTILKNLLKF